VLISALVRGVIPEELAQVAALPALSADDLAEHPGGRHRRNHRQSPLLSVRPRPFAEAGHGHPAEVRNDLIIPTPTRAKWPPVLWGPAPESVVLGEGERASLPVASLSAPLRRVCEKTPKEHDNAGPMIHPIRDKPAAIFQSE
jgi:hypothetical protein